MPVNTINIIICLRKSYFNQHANIKNNNHIFDYNLRSYIENPDSIMFNLNHTHFSLS